MKKVVGGQDRFHRSIWDRMLFSLWEFNVVNADSKSELHRGITRCAEFLLDQETRRDQMKEAGETNIVRRGFVLPKSLARAWAWNYLEDCYDRRIVPPRSLVELIYLHLECTHLTTRRGKYDARQRARFALGSTPIREIARREKVNPTTVLQWKQELEEDVKYGRIPESEPYMKHYLKLTEEVRLFDYYPADYRHLNRKALGK